MYYTRRVSTRILATSTSNYLVQRLDQSGPLPAAWAEDGQAFESGYIYVAPRDHHMMVKEGHVRVVHGPKENRSRPAVDPLFRSAAVAYRSRAIGIVLTGMLNDGTVGLAAVKQCGGITINNVP